MNPKGSDEQEPNGRFWGKARVLLVLAALIAAAAIGYAVMREGRRDAEPARTVAPDALSGIEALERQAAGSPKEAAAWQRLGQAYFDDGRFGDAVEAYGRAVQIAPGNSSLWAMLGEARVMASKTEPLPAAAAANFAKALSLDPREPRARYFMAVKKDLAGDHAGAVADWLALLADTPKGAVWEADLRRTIEQVGKINRIDVAGRLAAIRQPQAATGTLPGPTQQDLAAAAAMPPGAQREMAEGMVARLEARLQGDPGNVDGWIMLMRSRMTLGQPERAQAALRRAVAANPAQSELLRSQAASFGVPVK